MRRPRHPLLASLATIVALLGGVSAVMPTAATDRVVIVRPGDTLSQIALDEGVTVAQLVALNGLADPSRIFPGQRLSVRASTPAAKPSPKLAPKPVTHRVRWGENLTLIAKHYGITIAAIVEANGLSNPRYLRVGQQLVIPVAAPASHGAASAAAAKPATTPVTHRVRSGENLTLIAKHYGISIAAIVEANGLSNPRYLRVGQQLLIPVAAPASGAPSRQSTTGMTAAMAAATSQREGVRRLLVKEARAQGVPIALVLAVAWQESGWQQRVVSSTGAIGVMQLMPATADWIGKAMLGANVDPRDVSQNVRAGVRLLKHYVNRYAGDRSLVLAAYYQGERGTDLHGVYPITRPYIAAILALETIFSR